MKDIDDISKEENKVKLNNGKNGEANKSNKGQEEPPSGYIHVRARRGQATDSHSLAERVILFYFYLFFTSCPSSLGNITHCSN